DLGVQTHVNHEAGAHHGDGVAVRRRLRDFSTGDVAAGAWFVVDVELLAERRRQLFRDDTGDDISRAAGGEANHNPHRMIGIMCRRVLREYAPRSEQTYT